jgi:hypothetical protein
MCHSSDLRHHSFYTTIKNNIGLEQVGFTQYSKTRKTCPQRNRWFQDKSSLQTGFRFIPLPRIIEQKCHQIYSTVKFVEQNFHSPHSESEFAWEVPFLILKIQKFRVRHYLLNTKLWNKSAIRFVLCGDICRTKLNKIVIFPYSIPHTSP